MCLLNNQQKLKIAEQDITCWKAITIEMGDFRPFYRREYTIPHDVVYGKQPYKANGDAVCEAHKDIVYPCVWSAGLIHTFKSKKDLALLEYSNSLMFECKIPKGTEYTEGWDNSGCQCYASKEIVFGEKVFDGREVCWQYRY